MSLFVKLLRIVNGKQYYKLTTDEKKELRENEYKKITSLYILTVNIFLVFMIFVITLISLEVIDLGLNFFAHTTTTVAMIFFAVMSVLLILQKYKVIAFLSKIKFDVLINFVILVFLTIITLYNIQETGYMVLYAAGLITFAFMVRMRPSTLSIYLLCIMLIVIIYVYNINLQYFEVEIFIFITNIIILNFITIVISREHFIDNIRNFTQQKVIHQQNIELEKISVRDYMTNIYNRRGFAKRIEEPIITPAAICLIDLDGLKLINDALGHSKGDYAIILTTNTIKEVFLNAYYARTGGDEFVIIIEETEEKIVAQKVQEFRQLLENDKTLEISISASLGYAMIDDQTCFVKAYKKAENIMYHIKLGARSSRKNRSMEALLSALHEYTGESKRHCHNVGFICQKLIKKIGYNRTSEQTAMKLIGQLHDIGKLSIPQSILQKKEKLTDEDWKTLKQHSEESYKIVCGLIDDKDIANAILYHHERWDGTGYPYNIKGENIPVYARVISVADAYDAMITDRVYQKKKTYEEACNELNRCSGTQFDPEVVDKFLSIPRSELNY